MAGLHDLCASAAAPDASPAAALCLGVQGLFLVATDDVAIIWWIPCMAAAFALMVGQLLQLCDLDLKTACYVGVHAFVLAEFAAALEWQLHYFLWGENPPVWWQQYALLAAVFGVVYLLYGFIAYRLSTPQWRLPVTRVELLNVIVIGILFFAMSNLSFYHRENPFSGVYARDIMNIRTLVDFAGNTVLIAYYIQRRQNHARKELSALQNVLESQYAQYRMSRETIELIDRKCH